MWNLFFKPLNKPIAHWRGRRVWLIGASSGIGAALAHHLHAQGAQVIVSARNAAALQNFVHSHPGAQALPCDVRQPESLQSAANQLQLESDRLDLVLYCAGYYQPMRAQTLNVEQCLIHHEINYHGVLNCLQAVLPWLKQQGHGHISVVSSVAGMRGLPKALAYGPTKAALINLAEILYVDLKPDKIDISLINPGFVKTPMTAQNDFEMPALITPDEAAQGILKGWAKGQFHIHFPKRFTRWMLLLRILPARCLFAITRRL